jgi:hypothetical protein
MEVSVVRQRLNETIERAKRRAAERRARADDAGRAYDRFLEHTAVPLFRQVANALRADGHLFNVFTPSGSVRLMSDRHAEDFIEILLDTAGDHPYVVGHTSRGRGRRVDESERELGDPATLGEEELIAFVLRELEPFVER